MSEPNPDPNQRSPLYKPDPEFIINDLETLKVLADPLRIHIVELVTQAPRTVKQVAAVLNMPPTKLYYHIKQLEERSLIRVVDTRIVSGIVEKQYQAAALSYRVNRELFSLTPQAGKESLNVMLTGLFDDTREDIQTSAEADVLDVSAHEEADKPLNRSLLISRQTLYLKPDTAEEFYGRLKNLVREYVQKGGADNAGVNPYGLLVALYPSTGAAVQSDDKS